MLMIVESLSQLEPSKLMDVYSGSVHPDDLGAVNDFYFAVNDVFANKGFWAIWQDEGRYLSALRMEPYRDGFLLTGLETAPSHRNMGHAKSLVCAVLLAVDGCAVYSHVGRNNVASASVHRSCGFRIHSDHAVLLDGTITNRYMTLIHH